MADLLHPKATLYKVTTPSHFSLKNFPAPLDVSSEVVTLTFLRKADPEITPNTQIKIQNLPFIFIKINKIQF
jgi:hypothetical protein